MPDEIEVQCCLTAAIGIRITTQRIHTCQFQKMKAESPAQYESMMLGEDQRHRRVRAMPETTRFFLPTYTLFPDSSAKAVESYYNSGSCERNGCS